MKNIAISAFLALTITLSGTCQSQPATEQSVRQLLIQQGTDKLMMQTLEQIIQSFKSLPQAQGLSSQYWDSFLADANINELLNLMVPIYMKHFTEADILELLKFYQTPVGQKLIEKTPVITQESMQVGQEWGMKLSQKVFEKLNKEPK
jgi:uncharacterized protein